MSITQIELVIKERLLNADVPTTLDELVNKPLGNSIVIL